MDGNSESVDAAPLEPASLSHNRVLVIMAVLGVLGAIAGAVFHSIAFGIGIAFGTALAFLNYFWLRHSLQKVFAAAVAGEKPKVSALKYISRYLTLAAIVALVFVTGVLPVTAVILGLAAFGFAVVAEGSIRMFSGAKKPANV